MIVSHRLKVTDDGWAVALSDARLGYIHVDFRLGLDISDASGIVRVTVEQRCWLRQSDREITLNPDDPSTVAPILKLFNAKVDAVAIRRTGELAVQFADGHRLDVCPNDQYEAWQIACENEFLIVCAPGGSVTIFQEAPPES
jgi:hypothetical protein